MLGHLQGTRGDVISTGQVVVCIVPRLRLLAAVDNEECREASGKPREAAGDTFKRPASNKLDATDEASVVHRDLQRCLVSGERFVLTGELSNIERLDWRVGDSSTDLLEAVSDASGGSGSFLAKGMAVSA